MQSAAGILPYHTSFVPARIPRDVEALTSQLRTFSTLASHLRQAKVRNESQISAVEQEIDVLRNRLFGGASCDF
jgi:hypothetical protein